MMMSSNHGYLLMNKLFNTSFENGLRVLLILNTLSPQSVTVDRITAYDFMSIYGADFGITDTNLHGVNSFNFCELPAKRTIISAGIKEMALNGMIQVNNTKNGFTYAINETGKRFVNSIDDEYSKQYTDIIQKLNKIYSAKTDLEITATINQTAVKSLRR